MQSCRISAAVWAPLTTGTYNDTDARRRTHPHARGQVAAAIPNGRQPKTACLVAGTALWAPRPLGLYTAPLCTAHIRAGRATRTRQAHRGAIGIQATGHHMDMKGRALHSALRDRLVAGWTVQMPGFNCRRGPEAWGCTKAKDTALLCETNGCSASTATRPRALAIAQSDPFDQRHTPKPPVPGPSNTIKS